MSTLIGADTLPGGKHWSFVLRRGTPPRLIDVEGGANVGMLFYNPLNLLERYNAPDTLKCQHTFKLTRGHCLYSDMGRIFCSIVEDTPAGTTRSAATRPGDRSREQLGREQLPGDRNDWYAERPRQLPGRGRASTASAGAILPPTSTGSARSRSATTARWRFDASAAKAGASVELRFEMDTLVLLPHLPASARPRVPTIRASRCATRFATVPPRPTTTAAACRRRRTAAGSRTTASSTSAAARAE